MKMVSALKWFHNWLGFVVTLTLLVALTTGVYLGIMDMIKRLDHQGQQFVPLTTAEKAVALTELFARYPEMTTVRFPTEYSPFVQASMRGKTITLDNQLTPLSISEFSQRPLYSTLFWLHRNFLLADVGKYLNAWASLLAGAISLVGLYLWWRVRKGFRLRQTLPTNTRSSSLVKSHTQMGIFIALPLCVLCLTGFLITYKSLWTGYLTTPTPNTSYPLSQARDWHSQLTTAQALWPQATLVSVSKQGPANGADKPSPMLYNVKFDQDADVWLRQADRINFNFDTGAMLSAQRHEDKPLSAQIASFVRPLHDGINMPTSYVALITTVALLAMAMLLMSALTFYRRLVRQPAKATRNPANIIAN
ncbi:PepSY domain-containing protein [Shewanella sp. NIFS-20-20]|uniref:PepSY-associated TM helix domain-containing protein n=1 Tax=Shewanella sp. NIFS-20-20 TaxID=2853806 RepID=UPI001C456C6E|nr:PepSY-associated TM helix domain-containing protein [Shewanella sp. NIFS-20-20]MBV7315794.1 PepSY domain-containing protein [Shewanella sp. NIFS-20-20]